MHSVRFPKILTIELPELLRAALQQISNREPHRATAQLLEAVLAAGLRVEVLRYPETLEEISGESGDRDFPNWTFEPASSLHVKLNSKQTERVLRIVGDGASRTPEEMAMWMMDWGLDAYEESLQVIECTDENNGGSDP